MSARRRRHLLADDPVDARRRLARISAEPLPEHRDRPLRPGAVELHLAAEEIVGVEKSEDEVGVGHRRPRAAAPVGDRPRYRPGAARPDLEEPELADLGDAAAAGA